MAKQPILDGRPWFRGARFVPPCPRGHRSSPHFLERSQQAGQRQIERLGESAAASQARPRSGHSRSSTTYRSRCPQGPRLLTLSGSIAAEMFLSGRRWLARASACQDRFVARAARGFFGRRRPRCGGGSLRDSDALAEFDDHRSSHLGFIGDAADKFLVRKISSPQLTKLLPLCKHGSAGSWHGAGSMQIVDYRPSSRQGGSRVTTRLDRSPGSSCAIPRVHSSRRSPKRSTNRSSARPGSGRSGSPGESNRPQ